MLLFEESFYDCPSDAYIYKKDNREKIKENKKKKEKRDREERGR